MAGGQISQLGTLFQKISLVDAKCFDFARRADFDDQAAILYSAQDAGARDENLHRACTWFFRAKAQSSIGACQNLEGCVEFPIKPPKRMHRRCSRHYICML